MAKQTGGPGIQRRAGHVGGHSVDQGALRRGGHHADSGAGAGARPGRGAAEGPGHRRGEGHRHGRPGRVRGALRLARAEGRAPSTRHSTRWRRRWRGRSSRSTWPTWRWRRGRSFVAHGCTGKGNDQVRFDVSVGALAPDLRVIAPAREWGMSRDEEIEYAAAHNVPVPNTKDSPYSVDENLWGRSIEAGVLEDPWNEPPADIYAWTRSMADTPDTPLYLEIGFEQGSAGVGQRRDRSAEQVAGAAPERAGGRARRGPHRPPGEPAGGHQIAGDLRGARRASFSTRRTGRWRR